VVGVWLHNDSGQVVHTFVSLSSSSIIGYRPIGGDIHFRGWKDNSRSVIALAMCYKLTD